MSFTGTLHPYQQEAFDLMVGRRSALVAYEMGLGKTPTTIAALEHLMDTGDIIRPGVVVALSGLKYQWAESIAKFSDDAKAGVVDGTPTQRYKTYADFDHLQFDYLVMNYEQVVNDWDRVRLLHPGFLVLDEATMIKSFTSKRAKVIKKWAEHVPVRYALTGTPIENGKPEEVFSIMQFVDEGVLGGFRSFENRYIVRNPFGWVERYKNLPDLHTRLSVASVRKKQKDPDVAPYLPEIIHNVPLRVSLDTRSAKAYETMADELQADLDAAAGSGRAFDVAAHYGQGWAPTGDEDMGKMMSKIQAIRMMLDHPDLLRASAQRYEDSFVTGKPGGSAYAADVIKRGLLDRVTKTPKLDAAVQYVSEFLDEDPSYKAVIFSQYVPMVDILATQLKSYGVATFTGKMSAKEKETSKRRFQENPSVRILVSSDAGGYGVDLPQANLLLNYDLPDKAGAALQRNSRIIRASSEWKSVVIQDVLIRGSLEERQWDALQDKSAVQAAVVDGEGITKDGDVRRTAGSLSNFLDNSEV